MRRFKKFISILLIFFLIFNHLGPGIVLADEGVEENTVETLPSPEPTTSPEPTATPTPTTEDITVDNQAEVVDEVVTEATSGGNVLEASASASPILTPEPTLEEEASNEADLTLPEPTCQTPASSEAVLKTEVEEATPEASLCPTPSSTKVTTGDTVSTADLVNDVNTTEYNSQVQFNTLNIFVADGVDLTKSPLEIASDVFDKDKKEDPTVNVQILKDNNYAYVENNIITTANTGDNGVTDGLNAVVNTGDAYSILSLLNKVNTTIVDSTVHIITINIFGQVDGNVILPEFSIGNDGGCCGNSAEINNGATVENNVGSSANTGENTIISDDQGDIKTGDARSVVNITNMVNTTIMNAIFHYLKINVLGEWTGNFLGWDDVLAQLGGESLLINSSTAGSQGSCDSCNTSLVASNSADVVNNVTSSANTGGNTINGAENGTINTGNAYSAISIYNLINSTIINSIGFLGSINIFGSLRGNVGGASLFVKDENNNDTPLPKKNSQNSDPSPHETGGKLAVYQHTNVGDFVYPGDTVTFFITIRNTGTGKVYGSKLDIGLIKGGEDKGGAIFDIGDIEAGKGYQINTGLVLAKDAEPGSYLAHVTVTGNVGPNDTEIYAYADSYLTIKALSPVAPSGVVKNVDVSTTEEVLGATTEAKGMTTEQKMELLLIALLAMYLPGKSYQRRRELARVLVKGKKVFVEKSTALRTFLTSILY